MSDVKIKLRHYAYDEGRDAVSNGYHGVNPYKDGDSVSAKTARAQWTKGYVDAVTARLAADMSALP